MKNPAHDIDANGAAENASARRPTLTLDVALFERHLEDSDLSEGDRRATLEALWAVIVGFVDLGFAVEPAAALADKSDGPGEVFASAGPALLQSSTDRTSDQFEKAAAQTVPPGH